MSEYARSLGNDETCVEIMRMVHAVIEGGGALILLQAGLASVLVTKIKVCAFHEDTSQNRLTTSVPQLNMKTPLLPMILALLFLMVSFHPHFLHSQTLNR